MFSMQMHRPQQTLLSREDFYVIPCSCSCLHSFYLVHGYTHAVYKYIYIYIDNNNIHFIVHGKLVVLIAMKHILTMSHCEDIDEFEVCKIMGNQVYGIIPNQRCHTLYSCISNACPTIFEDVWQCICIYSVRLRKTQ